MQWTLQHKCREAVFVLLAVFALLWGPAHASASVNSADTVGSYVNQTFDDSSGLQTEAQRPSPHKCFDFLHYSGTATTRSEQRPSKQTQPSGLASFLVPLSIGSAKHSSSNFGPRTIKHDSLSVLSRSMRNRN